MITIMLMISASIQLSSSFTIPHPPTNYNRNPNLETSNTALSMGYGYQGGGGRSSSIASYNSDRSKRQERVGHIVRTEIATIIQLGYPIKNQYNEIDDELRRRINVVNADVSPDLRQARITVSIMKRNSNSNNRLVEEEEGEYDEEYDEDEEEEYDEDDDDDDDDIELDTVFPESRSGNGDSVVDRRRSYSWLVRNTKQIRHAMSQRLSHMKTIPNLTFVLADVGAAVDVMNLIDKVSKGNYKRDDIGLFGGDTDNLPAGMYLESELEDDDYEWFDDDEDDDDDEWFDEEDDDDEEEMKDTSAKAKQK